MGTFSDGDREGADDLRKPNAAAREREGARGGEREHTALRGGFWRPGLHRRFVPLLIALVLASSLGVAGLAYFGERESATSTARTSVAQDVRVLRQLLADQGAGVTSNGGQLVVGQDNAQLVLNGDSTLVDRAHDATGAYAAIYQLQGPNLVSVAGNIPTTDAQGNPLPGRRLLGDTIGGPAYDALLGNCGATDTPSCHQTYSGVVTLHGVSYVAAYAPLSDNGGAFVGALAAAVPLDRVLAPVTQQAVLLVLIGLLLGMVALVAGYWVFESGTRRSFVALDAQLDAVSTQVVEVRALARHQVARAAQQERTAQRAGEQSRTLDALARAMEQGYTGLRESAGDLWAEMSQPGAAPDPARVSAQARQTAVIAARVGTAAAQARDLSRHLALAMRQVIVHTHAITDGGRELDLRATELLGAVEQAGTALAERLAQPAEQKRETGAVQATTGQLSAMGDGPSASHTGIHRTLAPQPGQTGSMPRVRPSGDRGLTGEQPLYRPGMSHATGGFPAMPPSPHSPLPQQQTTPPPGQMRSFAVHPSDTPRRFPDTPSGFYRPASQIPNMPSGFYNPPSQFPNPSSQVFGGHTDTLGRLFAVRRSGEWPPPQSSPAPHSVQDATAHEQPQRSSQPGAGRLNRLGLPDLSEQDHAPDWRDGEPQ